MLCVVLCIYNQYDNHLFMLRILWVKIWSIIWFITDLYPADFAMGLAGVADSGKYNNINASTMYMYIYSSPIDLFRLLW
jgi:hypothetical protein